MQKSTTASEASQAAESRATKHIPNSCQVPNAFFDELMAFLTPEEWKVVSYAARRTYGFQCDRDRISLTQFTSGIVGRDGRRLDYGTGLTRSTVVKALSALRRYGVIVETAPGDAKAGIAPEYRLQFDDTKVDYAGLHARQEERSAKDSERTSNARSVRHTRYVGQTTPGMSDRLPLVCATDNTRSVGHTDKTQLETQLETQKELGAFASQAPLTAPALPEVTTDEGAASDEAPTLSGVATPLPQVPPAPLSPAPAAAEKPKRERKKKSDEPASPPEVRAALAAACAVDMQLGTAPQILQVNTTARDLWAAYQAWGEKHGHQVTPGGLAARIEYTGRWCARNAWQCQPKNGRAGSAPEPKHIREYWAQAMAAREKETATPVRPPQGAPPPTPRPMMTDDERRQILIDGLQQEIKRQEFRLKTARHDMDRNAAERGLQFARQRLERAMSGEPLEVRYAHAS